MNFYEINRNSIKINNILSVTFFLLACLCEPDLGQGQGILYSKSILSFPATSSFVIVGPEGKDCRSNAPLRTIAPLITGFKRGVDYNICLAFMRFILVADYTSY